MRPLRPLLALSLALAAAAACAAPANVARPAVQQSRNAEVITKDEVIASGAANAYDAVRSLRPTWFRTRGRHNLDPNAVDGVVAYLDNTRIGDARSNLRMVLAPDIGVIRYYDPAAANYRFGLGHTHGVIQVLTEGSIRRP